MIPKRSVAATRSLNEYSPNGGLALRKVGYDRYLKFVWPFLVLVFIVVCAFLGIAAAVG